MLAPRAPRFERALVGIPGAVAVEAENADRFVEGGTQVAGKRRCDITGIAHHVDRPDRNLRVQNRHAVDVAEHVVGLDQRDVFDALGDGGVNLLARLGHLNAGGALERLTETLVEQIVKPRLVHARAVELVEFVGLTRMSAENPHELIEKHPHPRIARLGVRSDPDDSFRPARVDVDHCWLGSTTRY